MKIELNPFEISSKDFFRQIFWLHAKVYCWVFAYASIFLCGLAIATKIWIASLIGISILAVIFTSAVMLSVGYLAFSKKAFSLRQKRTIFLDEKNCHIVCEDGLDTNIPTTYFSSIIVAEKYYRIYLSSNTFVPILKTAFRSEEDRISFETEIPGVKLQKTTITLKKIIIFLIIEAILLGLGWCTDWAILVLFATTH
ncbi:MAG: hypothetical protein LBL62_01885 [Planctomycetaceae bacterium]|jgi:hypothetical protein|nr:hypothetical protein [Planctomycetaceae bacterium]